MSYTKITVSGSEVGLKFGYLSYKLIMTDKNRELFFDEDGTPNDLGLAKIIYSGYQNNCVNKNTEVTLSIDDFSRSIDSMITTETGKDELAAIIKSWAESTDIQNLVKDVEKKSQEVSPDQSTETLTESSSLPTESLESAPGS